MTDEEMLARLEKIPQPVVKAISFPLLLAVAVSEKLGIFPVYTKALRASQEVGKAERAYKNGNPELAFTILKPIADLDAMLYMDPTVSNAVMKSVICSSAYFVGLMNYYGKGVSQSWESGDSYFRKAADLGHEEARKYLKEQREA